MFLVDPKIKNRKIEKEEKAIAIPKGYVQNWVLLLCIKGNKVFVARTKWSMPPYV
jgi:hypothetical protein